MWRVLLNVLFGLLLLLLLAIALLGWLSTRHEAAAEAVPSVTVYAVSNGVHISLALPVQHEVFDWRTLFDPANSRRPALAQQQDYVLIGWGSKTFYTQVPTWSELTLPLAVQALAFDAAAFNVTYLPQPQVGESVRAMRLSGRQYRQLVEAMVADVPVFKAQNGQPKMIPGVHYGVTDVFYEAKGRYTPWFTCNEWIRQRLNQAEVDMPLWSPFATPIMWHLRGPTE
ncbi:MAG: TIGR02117 family protein [Neisseriaceae bacterium]|nr:TIGR02117 family protein [Neisseriaceae bacterium]MBP6862044.1 TIGR02117 family protein [Neisseriaceae bacterium]